MNFIELHKQTIIKVFDLNYFTNTFLELFDSDNADAWKHLMELTDPVEICNFWNDFWEALPDNLAIRVPPFFDVCELAEGSYVYEKSDEYRDSL